MIILPTKFIHKQPLSILLIAVQIGFDQTSYTVAEGNDSVTVCVNMTTGSASVLVSLETIDIGSAQSMHMNSCCLPQCYTGLIYTFPLQCGYSYS